MTLEELVLHAADPDFFPPEWIEGGRNAAFGQEGLGKPTTERLELVTLGSSQFTLNSRPLVCPRKSRELLIFLVCRQQGSSKEEIGLALWPDASPEQLRNVFHVTLSRLRSALGSPRWILTEGKYRINPDCSWECDAVVFERETNSALLALRKGDDGLEQLQRILQLYNGDFLAGESFGEWVFEQRDRLKDLYLEGLAVCGNGLIKQSRYEEAAAVFEKLLAADALDESAARRLMISLARSDRRAQALRVYRQLVQVLDRDLDSDPEPETVAVFEKLREK